MSDRLRPAAGLVLTIALGFGCVAGSARAEDDASAAVARYAGPQTAWQGPAAAPKPEAGKLIVYLSGDEQNDISREYGQYMQQAAARIGWKLTVIDGKGSPATWVSGFNQAIAINPAGIAIFADAKSLQGPIRAATEKGITVIGLHAASLPGPQPDLHLFVNIQEDPREIGKAEADWAIADSKGTAHVVIVTHNEYQIAATKSGATRDTMQACGGCKVLDYVNIPASEVAQRMPQLTTSWVQRFGLPLYVTSVGDNALDFAVPSLRASGVSPDQAKLIGADGNRSAYERIRKGDQYQTVTVSEPIELQAYQAIDEFNRAFNHQPPSGFVQPPYLVTAQNVDQAGGKQDMFVPENGYKAHYLKLWGAE